MLMSFSNTGHVSQSRRICQCSKKISAEHIEECSKMYPLADDNNSRTFPFLQLPMDLQLNIRDRLEIADVSSFLKVSESMAKSVDQQLIIQQVESQLREYLEPRGIFSIATCRSILTLSNFSSFISPRQGAMQASKSHVQYMKMLLAGSYHWEASYLRFILVALSPYRTLFGNYASNFMTHERLRTLTSTELHVRATHMYINTKEKTLHTTAIRAWQHFQPRQICE